jgi:inosine-uridine nucleoside N-ribohydrolase
MERLILDVDTGEGDAVAILLAIADGLPLDAVITSYGYTTLERATYNTASVIELTNASPEIWMGAVAPMAEHPHFPDGQTRWENVGAVVGGGGLSGVSLKPPERLPIRRFADSHRVEEIARRLRERAPVHYCVTGPCTNLALLCQHLKADVKNVIGRVTILGGAFRSPGDSGPRGADGKQLAEFNAYCDPTAMDTVIRSGLPVSLVTGDTTKFLIVPKKRAQALKAEGPCAELAKTFMNTALTAHTTTSERAFELKEAAALWLAYHDTASFSPRNVAVETGSSNFGATRLEPTGTPVGVYMLSPQRSNQIIYDILQRLSLTDPL